MLRQKRNAITVMPWMHTVVFGITWASMKSRMAKQIPILLKQAMPNSDITWPDWLDLHAAFLAVPMHLPVPFACLFTPSITGNYTNRDFLLTLPISRTLLAQSISHSFLF